jgi:hypothetical protein
LGRNTLIGPGFGDVDFSVAKDFPLHFREGMSLQIRADFFNVFNHPNFANPDGDVAFGSSPCSAGGPNAGLDLADCQSGVINHTDGYGGQRSIQLGAHFTF